VVGDGLRKGAGLEVGGHGGQVQLGMVEGGQVDGRIGAMRHREGDGVRWTLDDE
jgi:hypothetical protein